MVTVDQANNRCKLAEIEKTINELVKQLGLCLKSKTLRLATAESCTGGWIAKAITDLPGSSDWFECSVVSYSNASKHSLLCVPEDIIENFGAVSRETVLAMSDGLFKTTAADVVVSVSGVAGPGGGSDEKPVGTVWLGWGQRNQAAYAQEHHFTGDREAVRLQSVMAALTAVIDLAGCDR